MNIAQYLMDNNSNEELNKRLKINCFDCEFTIALNQDWEKGITEVVFCDKSKLVFDSGSVIEQI